MAKRTRIRLGEGEVLTLGTGGWTHYRGRFSSGDGSEVWVRLEPRPDGRLEAIEVHAARLSAADLRAIPLGRIEAAANEEHVRRELLEEIDRRGAQAGAPLARLRRLAPSSRERELQVLAAHEAWLAPFLGLQATLSIRPRAGQRGSDDFYRDIAAIYERLAATTRRPAPELAHRARVSESTVHRWVKEARKRGLMAPGRRG
jgi:hypothetical protein